MKISISISTDPPIPESTRRWASEIINTIRKGEVYHYKMEAENTPDFINTGIRRELYIQFAAAKSMKLNGVIGKRLSFKLIPIKLSTHTYQCVEISLSSEPESHLTIVQEDAILGNADLFILENQPNDSENAA